MEATSRSTTIDGVFIKFKNRRCLCGVKAVAMIMESQNSPYKLYFVCEKGKYKFYNFWEPYNEECNLEQYSDRTDKSKWKVIDAGDVVGKGAVPRKLPQKNSTPRVYARRVKANCGC
ncbi:hypothetical protein Ddye_011404 [Dipteronia dyeriana]|uniref:Uncharacterized protein n=1 Tax=Dipteronia dyeriana TaxID=168575 RepID=A0AAD9X2G3_9ROSI|nr:hypothetical protein Ddye_011404 [Dipteronia dyeriana]